MVKKTLAVLLATVMFVSLSACKDKEVEETTSKATEAATASETTEEVKADPVELRIHWHSNDKFTLADENGTIKPVFALAAEKTNTILVNTANPVATKSAEEFQLQAAEKFPDDIYGGNGLRSSILSYANQGAFLDLTDLIDKYAPDIKAYMEAYPDRAACMKSPDGSIYMINYSPDGDVGRAYFIRTDWLNKLNLKMPTTFDELETVLYAFRDQDPNGNGEKDEVPLFNDKKTELIRYANLWNARVYGNDNTSERIILDKDGKFYHGWTAPEFKTAMIGMAKWYKDKIIDQEAFTRKNNSARPTLWTQTNTGGMTHEWLASTAAYNANEELLKLAPDFKVEAMLPPSYDGTPGFEEHRRIVIKPDGWAISANCKNPEAAIKFMNWFFTEEGQIAANYGIEGESYTMVNGKPVFTDEVLSQTGVNLYLQTKYGAQYPIGYAMMYDYERQWTLKEGQDAYDLYEKNIDTIRVPETPVMSFTEDEQKIYDTYISGLNTYLDETVQGFITGTIDVESEWDNYVAKCKELGSDELVKLYQTVYDSRMK